VVFDVFGGFAQGFELGQAVHGELAAMREMGFGAGEGALEAGIGHGGGGGFFEGAAGL